jgi:predicted metal-dependent hydrolase
VWRFCDRIAALRASLKAMRMSSPAAQLQLFESWPVRERVSARARRVRVDVSPAGEVILTIPQRGSRLAALAFLHESRAWIEQARARLQRRRQGPAPGLRNTQLGLRALRALAETEGRRLLDEESARLGLRYARLSIRDPRTRWGSCAPDGRIMLSLRLAMAPPEVFRYVAVHELCHLRWRGHGVRFWQLVERQMPDYARHRQWLNRHGDALQAILREGSDFRR